MIVDVERVATGGSCVGRAPDGRVVFVRHAIPGEQVEVVVTEERRNYLRADAVRVLRAAAARVDPPCPWSGPGRCGGCDWQHVELAEQRRFKATVVREQFHRLARLDVGDLRVEEVPGADDGLHWRTRVRLAVDEDGRAGLHRHRSDRLEAVGDCLITVEAARIPEVVSEHWPAGSSVHVDATSAGDRIVTLAPGDDVVHEVAAGRKWQVPVAGFWQVHVGAPDLLAAVVADYADVERGDRCLDLYAGAGLFTAGLVERGGQVTAVESDQRAVAAARANVPAADVIEARVERWLAGRPAESVDLVVLDPPRRGAGADVVRRIAAAGPRRVVYVACDPAALARDVATFAEVGYRMTALRAFDAFPMTEHVECVARLEPAA